MGESYPKLMDVCAKCERLFDGIEDKHLSVAIAYAQLTNKRLQQFIIANRDKSDLTYEVEALRKKLVRKYLMCRIKIKGF